MKTLTRLLGLLLVVTLAVSVPMQDSYAKWTQGTSSEDGHSQYLGWGPTDDGDPEEPSLGHGNQTRASQEASLDAGDEDRPAGIRVIWLLVKLGMLRIVAF